MGVVGYLAFPLTARSNILTNFGADDWLIQASLLAPAAAITLWPVSVHWALGVPACGLCACSVVQTATTQASSGAWLPLSPSGAWLPVTAGWVPIHTSLRCRQVARAWVGVIEIASYPIMHNPARAAVRDMLHQLTGVHFAGVGFNVTETLLFFCSTLAVALAVGAGVQCVGGL